MDNIQYTGITVIVDKTNEISSASTKLPKAALFWNCSIPPMQ